MKIKFHSPKHVDVVGNDGQTYMVNLELGTCTCLDFTFRGFREAGYKCDHILQALDMLY